MPFCPILPVLQTFGFTSIKNGMSEWNEVEKNADC